jgi:hypothetical protein
MALVLKDRVYEQTTTTGTGTLTLPGAVGGYQSFSSAIGNGNTTYYTITDNTNWEVGLGTVSAGTLSRDTVYASSNAGSLVTFPVGTKNVFCDYPATKAISRDNLPTNLIVTVRAGTTTNVPLANALLPVLNRSGSTINVTVN